MGKNILGFIVKCFGFSVIWWFSWFLIFNPFFGLKKQIPNVIEEQERAQVDKYNYQLEEASRQLNVVGVQQKRMDALLLKYEQQAARFDAILDNWEKQQPTSR